MEGTCPEGALFLYRFYRSTGGDVSVSHTESLYFASSAEEAVQLYMGTGTSPCWVPQAPSSLTEYKVAPGAPVITREWRGTALQDLIPEGVEPGTWTGTEGD